MTSTSTTDGFYTSPVYKYSTASLPFSKEMIDGLKKDITRNVFQESPILSLLEKKTRAAEEQMKTELNNSMWGGVGTPITKKGLREIIGEAYDLHTKKEKQVDEAVDKIAAERKEAKAREVFDTLDGIFADLEGVGTGALAAWTVEFDVGGKEYNYAAVLSGDGCWYITGKDTFGRKAEEFKAYIAEKALNAHRVEFEGTVL